MGEVDLILVVIAELSEPVGYGEQFRCEVQRVLAGDFASDVLFLTVLAGDAETVSSLAAHAPPKQVEIGFTLTGQDAPYATMPVTGFVDSDRKIWTIAYIRPAPPP